MKKWLPSILAAAGAAGSIFLPALQALLAAHPTVTAVIASIGVILAHVLPSPLGVTNPDAK